MDKIINLIKEFGVSKEGFLTEKTNELHKLIEMELEKKDTFSLVDFAKHINDDNIWVRLWIATIVVKKGKETIEEISKTDTIAALDADLLLFQLSNNNTNT